MRLVGFLLRHWIITLIVVGALIYGAVHKPESAHPRPGYHDTGQTVTEQQCLDKGGTVVDDVCYSP